MVLSLVCLASIAKHEYPRNFIALVSFWHIVHRGCKSHNYGLDFKVDFACTFQNGGSSDQRLSGLIKKLEAILVRLNNHAAKKVTMAPDVVGAVPSQPELGNITILLIKSMCSIGETLNTTCIEIFRPRHSKLLKFVSS